MAAVMNWNTTFIDGKEFLVIDIAKLRIPLEWDPSSNVFLAVAAPGGGILNHPALVKGEDGDTPDLDSDIDFTPLEYDDPTPEFASWTETSPNLYKLSLGVRNGAPGDDGTMVLDVDDYGTPVAGRLLRLNETADGFEYVAPKVGDRFLPATIAEVPSGNAAYTLCPIGIDAQPFDWRPLVEGQTLITGTGADVAVNFIARLSTTGTINGETAGPIVAQAFQRAGQYPPAHVLSSAPPAGSSGTYDKVLAGNTATVYVRTERTSGANTYTTSSDTSCACVRVMPIP